MAGERIVEGVKKLNEEMDRRSFIFNIVMLSGTVVGCLLEGKICVAAVSVLTGENKGDTEKMIWEKFGVKSLDKQ